ncbi:MAG: 16S rRNA (cytosine(967)-C(5))-methyltransferase RsmB [Lachnospiraceae bacterium]|nr:16S rRNA (cytosine(967)-C(5))-methyltransferase RsmB [Lachnospiraceae bacterium]
MASEINVRELVLVTLMDIDKGTKHASEAISSTLRNYQYMSKQERSFYTRLCEGTLEYQIQLDYIINQVSKTPVNKCKSLIRNLFRMSLYQLRFMDSVPEEAVCNEAVKLAKKKGFQSLSGFVNGVLRNLARQQERISLPSRAENEIQYLSIAYSIPEWLVEQLLEWYSLELTETMLQAFLQESPLTVRVNLARTTMEEVLQELQKEGIQAEAGFYADNALRLSGINYVNRIKAFRQGWITVQDESSILQGNLVQTKAGDIILDVCAAPGGKSLHAAERLFLAEKLSQSGDISHDSGIVIARDISEGKVERIEENIERMGYSNLKVEVWNALTLDKSKIKNIDIVMADVPCSGLGVIGRKPDIKYHVTKEQLDELQVLQRDILQVVTQYVKEDGYFLYSTCTVNPNENEQQVAWIQEQFPFEPVDIEPLLPSRLVEQVREQPGTNLQQGYCTLLPGKQDCDGFFFALLRKKKTAKGC